MLHLEFLVEEPSMESFLQPLLQRILPKHGTYRIHNLRGKKRLLSNLPDRLRGYRNWGIAGLYIVVLVDRDEDDCLVLKRRLEEIAYDAGLLTRTQDPDHFQVVNRIVVTELESWILGDPDAMRAAYPRLSATFERTENLRDPDAIVGGAWEALERQLIQAYGQPEGWSKGTIASTVAGHLQPGRNRSQSFKTFWKALAELTARPNESGG